MAEMDVDFCFYDDPDFVADADRDSRMLPEVASAAVEQAPA